MTRADNILQHIDWEALREQKKFCWNEMPKVITMKLLPNMFTQLLKKPSYDRRTYSSHRYIRHYAHLYNRSHNLYSFLDI